MSTFAVQQAPQEDQAAQPQLARKHTRGKCGGGISNQKGWDLVFLVVVLLHDWFGNFFFVETGMR